MKLKPQYLRERDFFLKGTLLITYSTSKRQNYRKRTRSHAQTES
jgi:hypothetical protein